MSQGVQPFTILTTKDNNLNRVQGNIAATLNPIQKNPFINLRVIADQPLSSTGITVINHGLGYIPNGFFISIPDRPSIIWQAQDYNNNAAMTLWLYSTDNCNVSIGVY